MNPIPCVRDSNPRFVVFIYGDIKSLDALWSLNNVLSSSYHVKIVVIYLKFYSRRSSSLELILLSPTKFRQLTLKSPSTTIKLMSSTSNFGSWPWNHLACWSWWNLEQVQSDVEQGVSRMCSGANKWVRTVLVGAGSEVKHYSRLANFFSFCNFM